jgi:hypothetical protein
MGNEGGKGEEKRQKGKGRRQNTEICDFFEKSQI